MELEMLVVFSGVGLIVGTVVWMTLPSALPEPKTGTDPKTWESLDHLIAPHREPVPGRFSPKSAERH